jgi:tetratricopeptide (TPR) repeat protein
MQIRNVLTLVSTVAALAVATPALAHMQGSQSAAPVTMPGQKPAAKVPADELKAGNAIGAALDAAAMMQLAQAFVAKYPKSTLIHPIAVNLSLQIGSVTDMAQQLALAQAFRTTFPGTEEVDLIMPTIIDANLKLNKVDEAFKEASDFLSRHPKDLVALMNMTFVGAEQAKHKNMKYAADAEKDGLAAIAIIEGDQKPEKMDDAQWALAKTKYLAQLYQSLGVCSFAGGKAEEASTRFAKSVTINPKDPMTYMWMGTMANQEYVALSAKYKAATGDSQGEILKSALASLDRLIDNYAHVVALSEGVPSLKQVYDLCLEDLTSFYKYRHKGTDGLQALIDKYKVVGGI